MSFCDDMKFVVSVKTNLIAIVNHARKNVQLNIPFCELLPLGTPLPPSVSVLLHLCYGHVYAAFLCLY